MCQKQGQSRCARSSDVRVRGEPSPTLFSWWRGDITGDFRHDFFKAATGVATFVENAHGWLGSIKGKWCEIKYATLGAERFHFCAWMPVRGDALWQKNNKGAAISQDGCLHGFFAGAHEGADARA